MILAVTYALVTSRLEHLLCTSHRAVFEGSLEASAGIESPSEAVGWCREEGMYHLYGNNYTDDQFASGLNSKCWSITFEAPTQFGSRIFKAGVSRLQGRLENFILFLCQSSGSTT